MNKVSEGYTISQKYRPPIGFMVSQLFANIFPRILKSHHSQGIPQLKTDLYF